MEKVKIIVFEINQKLVNNLKEKLKTIPFVEYLENNINNTEEALELVLSHKPDVVILGNDFPGMGGFFFTQIIRKEASPTQVIMIAEVVSTEMIRQAMRSGACDYFSYTKLSIEELTLALEHAGQQAIEEMRIKAAAGEIKEPAPTQLKKSTKNESAKIISVCSPKGGAGVSTITVNLACVLAVDNLKVLVIDGDILFGDMEILLNQRSNNSIKDLANFADSLDEDVIKNVINHGKVDLLAAPSRAEEAAEITGPIFEKILQSLSMLEYDYLLINTGSGVSDSSIVALDKSDTIILVANQEISSVRSMSKFLNLFETIRVHPDKLILVLNKFDNNSALTIDKISKSLEMTISHTIPLDYETVIHANNLGIPFVIENEELPISRSIFELARLLTKEDKIKLKGIAKLFKKK